MDKLSIIFYYTDYYGSSTAIAGTLKRQNIHQGSNSIPVAVLTSNTGLKPTIEKQMEQNLNTGHIFYLCISY